MSPASLDVLGSTGLNVSRVGLGLAALGRPGYINLGHADDLAGRTDEAAMERRAQRVLDAAWAAGVRYFDAARSYGLAERFLANWLRARQIAPSAVVVASKWGYTYTAGWRARAAQHEVKEHSLDAFTRQWAESTALLGPFVKIYQIHSATLASGVLENRAVLDELARLKQTGVHVGLSVSGPTQGATLDRAMRVMRDGVPLFETVQATWNLLEPSAGNALAEARQAGMGIIIKEALANGRLTERNREVDFAPRLSVLRGEANRLGVSVDALAIAACLAQPFTNVVLSGAASASQLEANLKARNVSLDTATLGRLASVVESAGDYWQRRQALPWN